MSNIKLNRNIVFAIFLAVFAFDGFGGVFAQTAATPASNPAKAAKPSVPAKESNDSTSASKKKTANTVKPPKLAKETFSYIPYSQVVLKDGLAYKAGEDKPYTGYVWATREDLRLQPEAKYPGENVRTFHYHKDGKLSGEVLMSKYVPERSGIWETEKRQGGTTVSLYLLRDDVKTAISNDNFFERKDECFYLALRSRISGGDWRETNSHVELFDQDGTRRFFAVHRQDDSNKIEVVGDDGIFRKFTMNRKTGRPDGPMEAYHPNGKLFYQTVYTDGAPGSIVELFDPAGKKAFRLYFETNAFAERPHTSDLTLVEEWDEENHRFVDRDKEHFNMFIKFCKPADELIPHDIRDDLERRRTILLLEALKDTDLFDREVNLKDLLEKDLSKLTGEKKP